MAGIGNYNKKAESKRGFKMPGFSPFTQKVVPASKHEKSKNTAIAKGTDSNAEKINDLEDRIEFLQSDLKGGGKENLKVMEKGKIISQIKKIEAQLKKLRS